MDDTDKVQQLLRRRASRTGSTMLPPDVNAVELPLRAGRRAARSATAWARSRAPARRRSRRSSRRARRGGPFTRPVRLLPSASTGGIVNRRVGRGAGPRRRVRRDRRPPRARCSPRSASRSRAAEQRARDAAAGEPVRRGRGAAAAGATSTRARWTERERLAEEKAALGFYLSGHPFAAYRREFAPFVRTTLAELAPRNEPQLIAGMVASAADRDDPPRQDGGGDARRRHRAASR